MDFKQYLMEYTRKLGVDISPEMAEKMELYKNMLAEWSQKMNLTAITGNKDIVIKHFADSLSLLPHISTVPEKVIDIGTGAGFPGLPLQIAMPEKEFTLLDSLGKRVNFLNHVVQALSLAKTTVICGRAEDIARMDTHREAYSMCVSRAVAPLNVLVEYALPFLEIGGIFAAYKGPEVAREVEEAQNAVSTLGGAVTSIKTVAFPDTDIIHSLIIIRKEAKTLAKYPRKAGIISKKPIK